jgi:predicted DCC family thiol-disulfide oxidoreductase YuxK
VITVYFDGQCGLCRREISFYQRIASKKAVAFVDLTDHPDVLKKDGVDQLDSLRILHVRNDQNALVTGVDAFRAIWSAIPPFGILAFLIGLPLIRPMVEWGYARFAERRFKRLGYGTCDR